MDVPGKRQAILANVTAVRSTERDKQAPRHPNEGGGGKEKVSALARSLGGARKLLRLVLDLYGYLSQHRRVLPVVMRTEQQLPGVAKQDADVRLGAAAVTPVRGGERLGGG